MTNWSEPVSSDGLRSAIEQFGLTGIATRAATYYGVDFAALATEHGVTTSDLAYALVETLFYGEQHEHGSTAALRDELAKIADALEKHNMLITKASVSTIGNLTVSLADTDDWCPHVDLDKARDFLSKQAVEIAQHARAVATRVRVTRKPHRGSVTWKEHIAVTMLSASWFKSHGSWPNVSYHYHLSAGSPIDGQRRANGGGCFVMEAAKAVGLQLNEQRLQTIIEDCIDWPPKDSAAVLLAAET